MHPDRREARYNAVTQSSVDSTNAGIRDAEITRARFGNRQDEKAREARAMDRERQYWRDLFSAQINRSY